MYKFVLILLFLSFSLYGRTTITVTYPVQQYFIEKIAQGKVKIRVVHENFREFRKEDKTLFNRLSSSNYFFTFSLKEEKQLKELFLNKNKNMKTFDMSTNIKKIDNNNPYIWLDPLLVRDIAKNIFEKLSSLQKYDTQFFRTNYKNFLDELDQLYLQLREDIINSDIYSFLTYSDYWDYLASRYRLKVFKREYRYLKIDEAPKFVDFAKKEQINKIIIKNDRSYEIVQSLAGYIDATVIEHNIYDHEWKANLYMLVKKLTNKNLKEN